MHTSHEHEDELRATGECRGAVTRAAGALTALLVLAAAPLASQQPEEAEPRDSAQDAFAGPSVFDDSPDQGVTVSELTLEAHRAPPLVSISDFYRVSFAADWSRLVPRGVTRRLIRTNPLDLEMPPTVRGDDRVVLSTRGLSLEPGDTLQAVRRGRALEDGLHAVHSLALVEVTKVWDDSARARVRSLYASYQVGDAVIPAEPFGALGVRDLEPAAKAVTARVIGMETPQALVSTNDRVFLDAGSDLASGDELMVFSGDVDDPASADPEDRLGVVRVVRARGGTATARVVETREVGMKEGSVAVLVRRAASGDR